MNHPPLKEGATIHHLPVVRCALPGASCGQQIISAPLQSSQGMLHFPCAGYRQLPFYGQVFRNEIRLYFFYGTAYNEASEKLEFADFAFSTLNKLK